MLSDYQRYRLYEILPGVSVWLALVLGIVLSFVRPLWIIYFIIVFDIYWVLKVINFSFYLIIAWCRFRSVRKIYWLEKLKTECNTSALRPAQGSVQVYQEIHHLVFLTLYNESWEVVKSAVQSVCVSVYDKEKFVIVIAGEARRRDNYEMILQNVKDDFGDCFGDIVGVMHPANLPDEIPGKGSNLNYAEHQLKKYVDERHWDYSKVVATIFDIDTICHPQYFSYLTYLYCTDPHPIHSSFQPVALYNNNLWDSPAVLRIMAFGTTFWMLTSLARQDALVTFSSHSLSFFALVKAGYHDKRIVSEDSRIFYQCFLAFNGNYRVTPMYVPVSMDTVRDDSWWQSLKNLYKQQRRWAWGTEHIPFLLWEFKKKGKLIPWWKKFKWVFVEWEGKWSWCMVAIIITILGRLPMWVAPESVRQSALFFNAPFILQNLMIISMMGLILSGSLSLLLLPKKPDSQPTHKYLFMVAQWVLLPFTMIFMSAIPAIDAVTHLMLGKYLGFNVSIKKRIQTGK